MGLWMINGVKLLVQLGRTWKVSLATLLKNAQPLKPYHL